MRPHEKDIAEILSVHHAPPQSDDAARHLAGALRREMATLDDQRRFARRRITLRVVAVSLATLPFLIAFNVLMAWGLQEVYDLILPHTIATVLVALFAVGSVFGLSLTYGSLPVIGAYAMKMQGVGYDRPIQTA